MAVSHVVNLSTQRRDRNGSKSFFGNVADPGRLEPNAERASKRVSRRCLRVVLTTPQKQPKTCLIRATTQDLQDKAHFNRKQSLCFLALVVLRSCGH
jgi:hypothetical protein